MRLVILSKAPQPRAAPRRAVFEFFTGASKLDTKLGLWRTHRAIAAGCIGRARLPCAQQRNALARTRAIARLAERTPLHSSFKSQSPQSGMVPSSAARHAGTFCHERITVNVVQESVQDGPVAGFIGVLG